MSNTIKMMELLPYCQIQSVDDVPDLEGVYCYVVKDYEPGYSILIQRDGEHVSWKMGTWDSKEIMEIDKLQLYAMRIPTILGVMQAAGIPSSQYYFDNNGKLVDMRQSFNKFASPGMLRDIFAKCIGTQDVVEIAILTPEKIEELKNSKQSYIVKPSRFRSHLVEELPEPLYAKIS